MSTSDRRAGPASEDLDDIDPSIPAGTTAYWKARARQWQHRCQRAEREKTELIAENAHLRGVLADRRVERAERRAAIFEGDLLPGRSGAPRAL